MRKWIALLLLCLILLIGAAYVFIPNSITIQESLLLQVNTKAFSRNMHDLSTWKQWWPGDIDSGAGGNLVYRFVFNGNTYAVKKNQLTSHLIVTRYGNDSLISHFFFIPTATESIKILWVGETGTSYFPINRFLRYRAVKRMQDDWKTILFQLENFYSVEENLYGLDIKKSLVNDTALISTVIETRTEPSTDTIYRIIEQLRNFAVKKGALQTGFPMLNVTHKTDDDKREYYRTQLALPVNKKLADEGSIKYRWMLGGGNILVAEVKGGPHTIQQGFAKMETYLNDNNRIAPAIPFQSLVTDRSAQQDTSKWITKLYWPVM